jgi:hypothetical protein
MARYFVIFYSNIDSQFLGMLLPSNPLLWLLMFDEFNDSLFIEKAVGSIYFEAFLLFAIMSALLLIVWLPELPL